MSGIGAGAGPSTLAKVANFVAFQAAWFALVVGSADGPDWIGPVALGALLALHFAIVPVPKGLEVTMLFCVAVAGVAVDQLAVWSGAQVFEAGGIRIGLVPLWIAGLWLAFGTTLHLSMAWLHGRYLLGAVLGLVAGPLAYLGAEKLGAIRIGDIPRTLGLALIGVEWAVMMPLLLWLAARLGGRPVR